MDKISDKNRSFLISLALILITLIVFYQVRGFSFVNIDDSVYVSKNLNIQAGITLKSFKWAFTATAAGNWHPLTWLSHTLDWQMFGNNPAGHHIVNLVFHIVNTLLLFLVLKKMTNAIWPSAFVAALFALHPLHIESVAWVSERKDVLSTFFWLLTMWAYVRYCLAAVPAAAKRTPGTGPGAKHYYYLLVIVFFALGLMAKPMLVTLPFVFLLLDYWPLGRTQTLYRLILEKIPFFVLSIASGIVTFLVQRGGGAVAEFAGLGLKFRICNVLISYVKYIGKMFWPTNLAFFYPYPVQNASIFYAVISAIFLLAVTIFVLRFAKSHRYLFTGWFWYLGTLVPVIGLVQVGEQAMADRYSYISLTGLFIIIAWGLAELRNKKAALVLSVLIISAMSICTSFELRYWRNSLSLFQRALDVTKNNYMAHFCIAEPLLAANGPDEAIYHYRSALQIKPTYIKARIGLAIVLLSLGRDNEAVKCLDEALRIKPDSAEAHANMGRALARQGNTDRAIQHFEEALRLEPDWIDPMNSLAWLLATSGKTAAGNPGKAIKLALRACELTDYNSPELLDTLAVSYAAAGDFGKAIETTEKAIELCQSGKQETLKKEIESRVVLFKAGKPYIETK